jgi:phasin family protein
LARLPAPRRQGHLFVHRTIFLDKPVAPSYAALQHCCVAQSLQEQTTMTKTKENIEMINEFNSKGYDSFRQLADISVQAWNQAMDTQIDAYRGLMNSSLEQIKLVTEAKDYQEVLRGQMDLTRKIGEELVNKSRDAAELGQKTGEAYREWFESSLNSVNEQVAKAVGKTA